MAKRTEAQQRTIDSFNKVDDHIYTLVYQNDYALDKCLTGNVKSVVDLLKFMIKVQKPKNQDSSFACSCFEVFNKDGNHITGRNFDYMDAPLIVVWTAPKNGYKSLSVCNCTFMLYGKKSIWPMKKGSSSRLLFAPYTGMDGINEKGLTISILEIKTKLTHQNDANKPHIQTTTIIRDVLDRCATTKEAIDEFAKYNMNDAILCNYHYVITDNEGDTALIEYVDNKMVVVKRDNDRLAVANFFLAEGGDNSKGFGQERVAYIESVINDNKGVMEEQDAMQILNNVHLDYKHDRGYQIITLWSSVYDSKDKSLLLAAGLDYDSLYKMSVDKPGVVTKVDRVKTPNIKDFPEFTHKDKEMV